MALRWLLCAMILAVCLPARDADGPDYYRVRGVASGSSLILRSKPDAKASPVGRIPANAQCLRSLGCQGGLSFKEYSTLSEEEQKRRLESNPRWCKVEYQGTVGWVAGSNLAEGACPDAAHKEPQDPVREKTVQFPKGQSGVVLKDHIKGYESVKYKLNAAAGQKMEITLKSSNASNYFNVQAPGEDTAIFIGSTSGNHYSGVLPKKGDYIVDVYLMRNAARRNEVANYSIDFKIAP
jgi:hypothetical protein